MNKDSKDHLLFQDFIPPTKKEWIDKATADLKGADFNKRLVWQNLNGIAVQPFYTRKDQKSLLNNTGENSAKVYNYRRIVVADPRIGNSLALKALEEGMTGILFEIKTEVQPSILLENIDFNNIAVSFSLNKESAAFATAFKSYLTDRSVDNDAVSGYIDFDIFNAYLTSGSLDLELIKMMSDIGKLFTQYPNFKTLVVSGTIFQDAGSNQVQEIAYTLNAIVCLANQLLNQKWNAKEIFDNLHVVLGISSEYFIEIAKFRVFKSLLHDISEKYGVSAPNVGVTGKTSIWSKSVTDANTNMLRSTTEAMSALLGNVGGIELDPFDKQFADSSDFSNRIAGNITTILREESYFGKVANPVDGSYYIEELSLQMAQNALEIFKTIEKNGGLISQVENETIQGQIAEIRLKKIQLLSQRRMAMVGVNKYPNLMESVSEDILENEVKDIASKVLQRQRAGVALEKIRYATEQFVNEHGFRPVVEIVSFGQLTMRKARAAFAYDFMGVSGFTILDEQGFESYNDAVEKSTSSESNIIVICSSDPDYQECALEFIKDFRSKNTSKVVLLAGYPKDIQEALLEAGLDGFIHVKSDIFTTLTEIQQKISKTIKPLEI